MTAMQPWIQPLENEEERSTFPAISFEHTYKTSYSHGLEKIYALENIDIRSVRRIESDCEEQRTFQSRQENFWDIKPAQLELDFTPESIEPFILRQPIQVLGLHRHIERKLQDVGVSSLKELIGDERPAQLVAKGIPQGFVGDIFDRLDEYLEGVSVNEALPLNFSAWLHSLISELDPRKAFVVLGPFQLAHMVSLSSKDSAEVRKLTTAVRQQWLREALATLRCADKRRQVHRDVKAISEKYLLRWLYNRQGIATEAELTERLLSLSEQREEDSQIYSWLKFVYLGEQQPLGPFFTAVEEKLYCADTAVAQLYNQVVEKAKSYFYKAHLHYLLPALTTWIQRECGREWLGFSPGFVERILRLSSHFCVRKGEEGELVVRLAMY